MDKELSINMVLNVYLCSNETVRVTLLLTDLIHKNRIKPVEHVVNFSKQTYRNGSKFYSELVRYKEFFFVIQIECGTLESQQNTAFDINLFCMTQTGKYFYIFSSEIHTLNLIFDKGNLYESILKKLCEICLINEVGNYDDEKLSLDHHDSSFDESNSQVYKGSDNSFSTTSIKTHILPEANKKLKKWYLKIC